MNKADKIQQEANNLDNKTEEYLFKILRITTQNNVLLDTSILKSIKFKDILQWGYDKIAIPFPYKFKKYEAVSFNNKTSLIKQIFRGKSHVYDENSTSIILNQKCNRWDEIDLSFAKNVNLNWLNKIDRNLFTAKGDIIINSTGEGTLGRASLIKDDCHTGLLIDRHMLLLRVNMDLVNPQLIVYLINSSFGQKQVEILKGTEATKQTELGIDNIKKILFPLPDRKEHDKIVNHISINIKKIKFLKTELKKLRESAQKEFENNVFY